MDERKTPPPRIASRTAVMAAVAVLIVIAIAGIVLASLRRAGPADVAGGTDSTQASAPALTAAAPADDSPPGELVFAPGSDQLSPAVAAKVALLAERAKKEGRTVVVKTKLEANAQRAQSMDLAKRRAFNVRGALTGGGVSLAMMKIEVTELPAGLVTPKMAQLVEVDLR
jgi:outer membrane protein OmpA-like peptidoglycan-associated protein